MFFLNLLVSKLTLVTGNNLMLHFNLPQGHGWKRKIVTSKYYSCTWPLSSSLSMWPLNLLWDITHYSGALGRCEICITTVTFPMVTGWTAGWQKHEWIYMNTIENFLLLPNFLHHKGKENCAKNSVTNNHKSKIYFPMSVQCHMSDELTKWVRYTYLFYTSSVVIIYPIISAQQYIIMSWRIWHLELMVQMMQ